jgi:hypothetical protein
MPRHDGSLCRGFMQACRTGVQEGGCKLCTEIHIYQGTTSMNAMLQHGE